MAVCVNAYFRGKAEKYYFISVVTFSLIFCVNKMDPSIGQLTADVLIKNIEFLSANALKSSKVVSKK